MFLARKGSYHVEIGQLFCFILGKIIALKINCKFKMVCVLMTCDT